MCTAAAGVGGPALTTLLRTVSGEQLGLFEDELDRPLFEVGWVAVDDEQAADLGAQAGF
jgi:hemolysin-activating ACP:hemolysin acyltransferase